MVYAGSPVHLTSAPKIFLAALFVVIPGCRERTTPTDAGVGAAVALPFSGCAAVVRGLDGRPVCELGDARRIRIATPSGPKHVDVPRDADHVTVDGFTLSIARATKMAWLDEAKEARTRGDAARARELALAHVSDPDPVAGALAEGLVARIDLAAGRAEDAFPRFKKAIDAHRFARRVSDAADDSFALAFALHQRSRRYDEARAVLDATTSELPLYPEGRAREPYYRGILAGETGDHRGALTLLKEASTRATELGMTKLARNARSSTALEMQELGRTKDALALLRDLQKETTEGSDASACERAELANNVGWVALLVEGEEPRPPLERALKIEGCSDAYVRSFALANLARLELREGHVDDAAQRLAEARAAVKEPRGVERIEHRVLDGRIELARGHAAKALAIFDEALAFARAAVLALPAWNVLTARAEAQTALGKNDDAARSLLDAERVLDEAALLVPLGEGRASFVADRSRSARAAVDLLMRIGRAADAARVARRSRARVLAGVERALRIASLPPAERARWEDAVRSFRTARAELDAAAADDWKLAADDLKKTVEARRGREGALRAALEAAMGVLSKNARDDATGDPPLAAGDLELVIHPGTKGWVAVARDADVAVAYPLPEPTGTSAELARALFDPITARIEHALRVRVRAYGAWRAVDVHALPWQGGPLVASVAVDYPVGLSTRGATSADDRALVVGDPTGDLPNAGDEARTVAATFPPDRVLLLVRDAANAEKVSSALRSAATFHYAGHGVFAGVEGWESALPLAGGGRLGVADVLALAPAPSRVVLSGCDAAKSEGDAEGLGLAQAFVAAGSNEVLAPVRPVADVLAAKLASKIHRERTAAPLAFVLRDAANAMRKEDPAADWAAFRVLAR